MVDRRIARSRAQERRGAALHGGSQNSGSGNTPWRKNDVRVGRSALIEYKRTDKKSITIKQEDLESARTNALLEGREVLLGIEIGGRDYVLVDAADYERVRRAASDYEHLGRSSEDAGARLDGREVLPTRGRPVLPSAGSGQQEAAQDGEGGVPGHGRQARVPGASSVPRLGGRDRRAQRHLGRDE